MPEIVFSIITKVIAYRGIAMEPLGGRWKMSGYYLKLGLFIVHMKIGKESHSDVKKKCLSPFKAP
jgi:hypothetical protein